MKKLVFFFPWHEVSGGPFYLTRLANDIAKLGLYDVYYTDYAGGLCDSLLTERSIKVLKFHDEEHFPIFPDEPVIIVMAEYWAHVMPKTHPDTKIVFFNWHNECIPVLQRDWGASDKFIKKFLQLAAETTSVFFCDKTHWMKHNEYGVDFPEEYVPIAIPGRTTTAAEKLVKEQERNIAVLGRLVVDKIYSVTDLLDNIIALRDQVKTNIYIIGEGDYEGLIFDRSLPKNIRLIRCGTMPIENVISLLSTKVDILFAMGTSVLEGATIKLPSVVVPNAMEPFECNRYPYLYESRGYALGWYPKQIDALEIQTHTIEEIFHDIYRDGKKAEIGEKCYQYYRQNHESNVELFEYAINTSTLTYEKYRNFIDSNVNWRAFKWRIGRFCRKLRGDIRFSMNLFGFPIYMQTENNPNHINVFICCLPILRINHNGGIYSAHLLPFVWLYQGAVFLCKKMLNKHESIHGEER